jgi:hypothetical protein
MRGQCGKGCKCILRKEKQAVTWSEALETYTEHTLLPFTQASGENRLGSSDLLHLGINPS